MDDSIFILKPTSHSSESFKELYRAKQWVGIYKMGNDNFSITKVNLKIENIFDSRQDKESEKSGRKVSATKDGIEPLLLISGINMEADLKNIKGTTFSNLKVVNEVIFNEYKINMEADTSDGSYAMRSFKLLIQGMKNGLELADTILEIDYFDDKTFDSFWVGDIDQDGLPDFILDASHKYSYSAPTLYLSSIADKNKLVKRAAFYYLYSC